MGGDLNVHGVKGGLESARVKVKRTALKGRAEEDSFESSRHQPF
jgi:hypothetical protein